MISARWTTWVAVAVFTAALIGGPNRVLAQAIKHAGKASLAEVRQWNALNDELVRLKKLGTDDAAVALAERFLANHKGTTNLDGPRLARLLDYVASMYRRKGDYARAESLLEHALAIVESAAGPDDHDAAVLLHKLAVVYDAQGDYVRAEPLFRRALVILNRTVGPDAPDVASALDDLGGLYSGQGEYALAEPLYKRSLAIREKAFGPDHQDVAASLNNLAWFYGAKGDYERAEPLAERALAIKEKSLGPEHPDLAPSLDILATVQQVKRNYSRAEVLLRRALVIAEKSLGPDHPGLSIALNNLAKLYQMTGDHARAEELYQRSLAIAERSVGPNHRGVGAVLNNLASLYSTDGDHARAETFYLRSLAIWEKDLGPNNPDVAVLLNNIARLYQDEKDYVRADSIYRRVLSIEERNFVALLDVDSSVRARAYLGTLRFSTNNIVEYAICTGRPHAVQLALTTLLRRKGRVLDTMAGNLRLLRNHLGPGERTLLDELLSCRSQRSTLILRGPGSISPNDYRKRLAELDEQDEMLEAAISARSASFRAQQQSITIAAVQAAIPQGSALIEWAIYWPTEARARGEQELWKTKNYVAVVLPSQGEPRWVDLGEAAPIDRAVDEFRAALVRPDRRDVRELAQALEAKVMRPVRGLLNDTRSLLLAPDGLLNLVPFAALVDETNHYLVERYSFTYLTSGRDLLRTSEHMPSRSPALVVTNPDYDDTGQPDFTPPLSRMFQPIVGAGLEARDVARELRGASVLTGAQANEAELKQVHGPVVLHVVTHGFFERPPRCGSNVPDPASSNPLARSGLALAGANACHSGQQDDGLLTALEVSGMDLYGTKLVVLSACETGVGTAAAGDGVYGLRRALVLAGAETQVMSLWRADNTATREQMAAYYTKLQEGGGRSEAMRQVQLAMLGSPARAHPYYWASFIVSGEQSSLDGRPVVSKLLRGPAGRGSCDDYAGGPEPERGSAWAAVALIGFALAVRRRRDRAERSQ